MRISRHLVRWTNRLSPDAYYDPLQLSFPALKLMTA